MRLRAWHWRDVSRGWACGSRATTGHFIVESVAEAQELLKQLADRDLANDAVIANAQGLEVFEDGEWCEWFDEEGRDVSDLRLEATP